MAVDHNNPQSRDEEILIATIDGNEYDKAPQSRMEELLLELKEVIEEGGGGGGTTNYENLSNQPQVNGETLIGDKTGADLGLVDAEEGKGLSTNDYDDTEKAAVAAATSAISAMKDGTDLDSFGDVEVALLDKADTADLGTAAAKDSTNAVTSGSTDLVESGAVKDAIDSAVSKCYHHAGTKTCAELLPALLIVANEGNVYEMTDSGTTTSDFMEGIGHPIKEGDNVGVAKVSEGVYKFDLLSGFVDTTNFVQKSQTAGLLKNDGTVNDEIEDDVNQLKSGLTNLNSNLTSYKTQNNINLDVPNRKNVLPLDVSKMKVSNHTGTWSGNAYTVAGVTFTLNITNGQIVSVVATGTAESVVTLNAYYNTEANPTEIEFDTDFILNGCPSDGGTETYLLRLWNVGGAVITDTGNGATLTKGTKINAFDIRIASGYECPSGGITFYPMLRPAFTDPTFAPYIPSVDARLDAVESGLTDFKQAIRPDNTLNTYKGDLDDLVESGNYLATTATHKPTAKHWYNVSVFRSYHDSNSDIITQMAVGVNNPHDVTVYYRTYFNGWSDWIKKADSKQLQTVDIEVYFKDCTITTSTSGLKYTDNITFDSNSVKALSISIKSWDSMPPITVVPVLVSDTQFAFYINGDNTQFIQASRMSVRVLYSK